MALDIDKTKIGSRSSRFGSRARSAFKGRHTSRGVMPLNQGSSPHSGGKSVMKLGGKAGGFGSGRAPGGGGGQGPLTAALVGGPIGPPPEVGPPPVDSPILPPGLFGPPSPNPIQLPPGLVPSPGETPVSTPIQGLFPRSEPAPEIDPNLLWLLGQRQAF